jgi:hypothetical protein
VDVAGVEPGYSEVIVVYIPGNCLDDELPGFLVVID